MRPPVLPHLKYALAAMLTALTLTSAFAAPGDGTGAPGFTEGVKAYRKGQFSEASEIFAQLHARQPHDPKITYYLAITSAQLGRFQQARVLYEEILLLDPNGEAAKLAQTGLKYLPPESAPLDLPPRFNTYEEAATPASPTQPQAQTAPANGMSPQDLMTMQMMMAAMGGGGNNQNGGGINMLPYMMMPSADGSNPMANIDPNVMSSMMMNQMMQNFDFSGNKDND